MDAVTAQLLVRDRWEGPWHLPTELDLSKAVQDGSLRADLAIFLTVAGKRWNETFVPRSLRQQKSWMDALALLLNGQTTAAQVEGEDRAIFRIATTSNETFRIEVGFLGSASVHPPSSPISVSKQAFAREIVREGRLLASLRETLKKEMEKVVYSGRQERIQFAMGEDPSPTLDRIEWLLDHRA